MADNTKIHYSSENQKHLIDLMMFKGAPINNDIDNEIIILVNDGYVAGFSPNRLQSVWSAYRVADHTRDVKYERPHLYYDDKRLGLEHQIGPETFGKVNGISYHVGHLVPNEVTNRQYGRMAQLQTFFMSNMCPQKDSLNTGVWKDLETLVRSVEDIDGKSREHIWAIAGPVFGDNPEYIDRPNGKKVPIPEACYYVTVDPFRYPWDRKSNVDVACFLIPQDAERNTSLSDYLVDQRQIEEKTKLSFFPLWDSAMATSAALSAPGSMNTRHRLLRQII